jgi:RHS repeat-associated protein
VSLEGYRFGYQGSEKDNEFKGEGNSYTTEFRQLDPRLGRWLSVDPVIQPWQSSYCSMDDSPIIYNDPNGLAAQSKELPPPGEKSANGSASAWNKYTIREKGSDNIKVLAPNGTYVEFKKSHLSFTYSDGKVNRKQQKKEGVWSVTNDDGNFLWDNKNAKFVLNESGNNAGQNGPPGMYNTTTYAGDKNPKGYSQPAQNIADQYGKEHDKDYDNRSLKGAYGVVSPESLEANLILVNKCAQVQSMYFEKKIDPYTGAPVSLLTYQLAVYMSLAFTITEQMKTPVNATYKSYEMTKNVFKQTFVQPLISIPSFIPQFGF